MSPIDAILSRSSTISVLAWSICTSVIGGNANCPLFAASWTICSAKRTISSWLAVDAMTNSTGKNPALGRADGRNAGARIPRDPPELAAQLFLNREDAPLALLPRLDEHAAEAARRERDLEAVIELRLRLEMSFDLLGVRGELLERRVGRDVDGAEDDALIFVRRELARREHVHRDDEERQRDPHGVDHRPRGKGHVERPRVRALQSLEARDRCAAAASLARAPRRGAATTSSAKG